MPYIKKEDRTKFDKGLEELAPAKNPGELNYLITMLLHRYMNYNGHNYQNCNDVLGALSGASNEFYRRKVAPYEDKKIEENGDV